MHLVEMLCSSLQCAHCAAGERSLIAAARSRSHPRQSQQFVWGAASRAAAGEDTSEGEQEARQGAQQEAQRQQRSTAPQQRRSSASLAFGFGIVSERSAP